MMITKQMLKENAQLILAAVAVISLVLGGISYFAKAEDLKQVEYRLDTKIRADKIYYLKRKLWMLFDKHKTDDCNSMPQPDCNICRDLKHELSVLASKTGV